MNNCKDLNCVCFECPKRQTCTQGRCHGLLECPLCEGFYVCSERGIDTTKKKLVKSIPEVKLRTISLEFPELPYSELYPNALRSLHWAKRNEIEGIAREEACLEAKKKWKKQKPMELAEVEYMFYLPNYRARDPDGLISACKPWIDGAVDAGIITKDDIWHIPHGCWGVTYAKNKEKTVITFKEVKA
jgi:hypothetical protein